MKTLLPTTAGKRVSEFFLATTSELLQIEYRPPQSIMQPGLVDSELDLLMLCNLESILTGNDWESVFDDVYINPVQDHGPDGPWIYQVSTELLRALKTLSPDNILDCAKEWSQTDEWTLREDTPIECITTILRELTELAVQADTQGKQVFIWTEL